jgi:polar amino acid transport system substrate-binding protein
VQVASTGRIPALLAGRADVTITSISVTAERAKAMMYCNPNGALKKYTGVDLPPLPTF